MVPYRGVEDVFCCWFEVLFVFPPGHMAETQSALGMFSRFLWHGIPDQSSRPSEAALRPSTSKNPESHAGEGEDCRVAQLDSPLPVRTEQEGMKSAR